MPCTFTPSKTIPDVVVIEPKAFGDDRGWFAEVFKASEFEAHGIPNDFVQDNHSRSLVKGTIRGLHYQTPPAAQGKLVRCPVGAVLDVAVDIRNGSPTYGRFVAEELNETNRRMLWLPPGFAHGVCTLTDVADVVYKVTAEYAPAHDRSIRWDDPAIGIPWPTRTPTLSKKDAEAPLLADAETGFDYRD